MYIHLDAYDEKMSKIQKWTQENQKTVLGKIKQATQQADKKWGAMHRTQQGG